MGGRRSAAGARRRHSHCHTGIIRTYALGDGCRQTPVTPTVAADSQRSRADELVNRVGRIQTAAAEWIVLSVGYCYITRIRNDICGNGHNIAPSFRRHKCNYFSTMSYSRLQAICHTAKQVAQRRPCSHGRTEMSRETQTKSCVFDAVLDHVGVLEKPIRLKAELDVTQLFAVENGRVVFQRRSVPQTQAKHPSDEGACQAQANGMPCQVHRWLRRIQTLSATKQFCRN